MSSTDSGTTVFDIIFVGGMVLSNSTLSELLQPVLLTIWIGSGGATACVTAGRLAEADPSLKILVRFQKKDWCISIFLIQIAQIVEAGPHTRDEPNHIQPGRYLSCFFRPTETFTFHMAEPSPAVGDRSVGVPTGRALGGGSSVNCMKATVWLIPKLKLLLKVLFYTRAAASDYDDWENVYGNKGWGSEHLIPLLKKVRALQYTQAWN